MFWSTGARTETPPLPSLVPNRLGYHRPRNWKCFANKYKTRFKGNKTTRNRQSTGEWTSKRRAVSGDLLFSCSSNLQTVCVSAISQCSLGVALVSTEPLVLHTHAPKQVCFWVCLFVYFLNKRETKNYRYENNDFGTNIPAWLFVVKDAPWSRLNTFAGWNKNHSPVARSFGFTATGSWFVSAAFAPIPPFVVVKLQDNCGKSSFCSTNAVRFVRVDFYFGFMIFVAHLFLFLNCIIWWVVFCICKTCYIFPEPIQFICIVLAWI